MDINQSIADMARIKFFSDYTDSENLLKRFIANYHIDDAFLSFTTGEDYDYAVAFNRSDEQIREGATVITVIQEPSFSEAHKYKTFLKYSDYLLIHDAALFEHTWDIKIEGQIFESPAFMFYDDFVDHLFFDHSECLPKTRKLSIIMSSLNFPWGNYAKRLNLLSKILNSDMDIDIFGRGLPISDPRYKGALKNKYDGLLPYEYSIAIENSNENNYISEKCVDCVLCNTTPIYNGAPNVGKVYDQRYFCNLDLDSLHIIEDIKRIVSRPSQRTLINKELYKTKYNLYTKLKEIISIDQLNKSIST